MLITSTCPHDAAHPPSPVVLRGSVPARAARRLATGCLVWLGALAALNGCSHVNSLYRPGPQGPHVPETKRLQVVAWAPAEQAGLARVLRAVAADYLKLRKNYLVQDPADSGQPAGSVAHWSAACTGRTEGVLFVRTLAAAADGSTPPRTTLALSAEVLRCQDGALLYRSEGRRRCSGKDGSLKQLSAHYALELGEGGAPYIPCAFSLLQELLMPLADPTLSEQEQEEKIELGSYDAPVTNGRARGEAPQNKQAGWSHPWPPAMRGRSPAKMG